MLGATGQILGMAGQIKLFSEEPDSDGLTFTTTGEIEYGE